MTFRTLFSFLILMTLTMNHTHATLIELKRSPAPQRVLLVGASLTSRLPTLLTFSLKQRGQEIDAVGWMRGGTELKTHIELGLLEHIREQDYDVVVLTAPWNSNRGASGVQALEKAARVIQESGAKLVIYTLPEVQATYEDAPERIPPSRRFMAELLKESKLPDLPVDRAFALAVKEIPYERLFVEDRVHFTQEGWYLTMCVAYAMFTGQNPESLPAFVTREDDVILQVEEKLATRLQAWAWTAATEAIELARKEERPSVQAMLSPRQRRPRLNLRSPGGDWAAYASGATVPVIAEVSSIAAPLNFVEILVDGQVVERLEGSPYRSEWTPPKDGVYSLRLRAVDQAGRHARTAPLELVIGELPPEPARSAPRLDRILWREHPVNTPLSVDLIGNRFEPAFANWSLMSGDTELARCPDTAMKLEWTPAESGYQDLVAIARTEEGTEYRSETVRVLIYDPAKRPRGAFLQAPAKIPGEVALERFDHGGDGVGWSGGTKAKGPRADSGIMIFPLEEREWILWAKAGNRMTYTVHVDEAGLYRPVLDAANRGREQGAKRLHLLHKASGQRVSFAVTPTGSNRDWIGFSTQALNLPAGETQLELHCEDGDINIDVIRFDRIR